MDRWACVDVFELPLQLLLADHPDWHNRPAAVVDRPDPRAEILHLNDRARRRGLRRGMAHSEAVGVVPRLCADAVDTARIDEKSEAIAELLTEHAPRIERDTHHPGVFWLEVTGLLGLYDRWDHWVEPLREQLKRRCDVYAAVVIGFSRFGTFCVVRTTRKSGLFESPERERSAARKAPLRQLELSKKALRTLRRLGIDTVGELLELPPEGMRRRLGEEAFELYRKARGDLGDYRPSFRPDRPPASTEDLERAEADRNRLLFRIKRRLQPLIDDLEKRGEHLAEVVLELRFQSEETVETTVRPAAATRDVGLVADLIRLRLEQLPAGEVTGLDLTVRGRSTTTEQLQMFCETPPRDIDAANRALARIRAEFGADSVVRALLSDAHLPESRFEFAALDELELPDTEDDDNPRAIRRFYPAPMQLGSAPNIPIRAGPHTLCGGWWVRRVHRDYHLAGGDGRLVWVFYDHRRRTWYVHGAF